MTDQNQSLQKTEAGPLQVAKPEPSIGEMLVGVLQKGVTSENVAAVGELTKLYERMQDRQAKKEFATAFVELQIEIPKIVANKPVPGKGNTIKYKFAPLEEIDAQLRPIALKHGFTYAFSESDAQQQGRITKVCTVTHVGGHSRSNPYTVRIGSGPPGSTESQADGSAHSYAKRGALCDAFNIVVLHQDTDGRAEGGSITAEQAQDLRRRVQETGSDEAGFLKFANSSTFEGIAAGRYGMLDLNLRKKERTT